MKRIGLIIMSICCALSISAQTKVNEAVQRNLEETRLRLEDFNTERLLDSLDQKDLPKLVSGGLFAFADMSNYIITRSHNTMSSHMRVGGELGGFLDFGITKHFAVQPQIIFTAQQNHFEETDTVNNHLWSFGVDIPIYFLGRFGNMQKGYIQFGAGIFTHFTFASNIANKFGNLDEQKEIKQNGLPLKHTEESSDGLERLYTLHNNHFGVCATVGYEFPIGIQINAQYKVSLSDIAGFYSEMKGKEIADALIYPQSVSLGIGYRWK